jgi:cytochrome c peroxidase
MLDNKKTFFVLLTAICFLPVIAMGGKLEPLRDLPAPRSNPMTSEKIELGKKLYFDRRLSGDGTMSCATCHMPELGYTDGQAISLNYPTTKNWRNAPTLINLAYNRYLFHDGRAESLEDQALFPILSAFEMNQNLDFLEEELRSVPEYVEEFRKVFGTDDITRERIAMAIAAFERTLVSRNAPLDHFLTGDRNALTKDGKKGLKIFTGKGKCTECHYGMNLIDDKFHALNVPEHPDFQNNPRVAATRRFVAKLNKFEGYRTLDEDPGRYLITKNKVDWRAFKTPTLREITNTGPYMHNGIFETLDEVIEFFDKGGGNGNTALKPLGLTIEEKRFLKKFLQEALSGERIVFSFPQVP